MSTNVWKPSAAQIKSTHIAQSMGLLGLVDYREFWQWSVTHRTDFWQHVLEVLNIPFEKQPDEILDVSNGVTQPQWLKGAKMNITDACFNHPADQIAIHYRAENAQDVTLTYKELETLVNRIANGLKA